jgi:hypothetical protein
MNVNRIVSTDITSFGEAMAFLIACSCAILLARRFILRWGGGLGTFAMFIAFICVFLVVALILHTRRFEFDGHRGNFVVKDRWFVFLPGRIRVHSFADIHEIKMSTRQLINAVVILKSGKAFSVKSGSAFQIRNFCDRLVRLTGAPASQGQQTR